MEKTKYGKVNAIRILMFINNMEGKESESACSKLNYEKAAERVVESIGQLSDMEDVRKHLNMLLKNIG